MIEKIIEFSAKNKFLVIALTAFAVASAVWTMHQVPLDALPDLSDTQVIIYSKWDRSPDILEDQVTYPIITALLGAPRVKDIRGFSDFGYSYVYVIFEDNTDMYWARSRTLEYLSKITPKLPSGVTTELGPDATGLGWVYQYALVDKSGKQSLESLRTYQDWNLRYQLQSVPGVAEVTSIGGVTKQYQINIDPQTLLQAHIPLTQVIQAVRAGNNNTGGKLLELSGREYMVRGEGYLKTKEDIENIGVGFDPQAGRPLFIKDVARVEVGSDLRRGVADLDGIGETVGGIVVMRSGENALNVINAVKKRLEEIKSSMPAGIEVVTVYDRSDLIKRAIATLKKTLTHEMIIVSLVILLFLWHIPSALIPIITIPISVGLAFIPMYFMGLTTNIMSLAGIAISIGVLVDGAIVEVENAYKKLEEWNSSGRKGDFHTIRLEALKEVGPSVFFSLLVIAVAFMPIFTLVDQEGRLFKPLAYSKNLTMALAALLAITLDPAIRMLFSRMDFFKFKNRWINAVANTTLVGRYYPEEKHPVSRVLFRIYEPACRWVLKNRRKTLIAAGLLFLSTIPVFFLMGREFMPPLNEGALLYMPTTLPGISLSEAQKMIQLQDQALKSFPEVERVFGKAGRAETSTDPAPLSMIETTILLKPESQWPQKGFWGGHESMENLVARMDAKMQIPGWTNAWTMPIKNRIDMLTTGIRTPVGIKILGNDPKVIEQVGIHLEELIKEVKGTRSVFAERIAGGYFANIDLKREKLAHFGMSVEDAQTIISTAIGGENLTTVIDGRARFPVNVRYAEDNRDDLDDLKQVLVPLANGVQVPLGEMADIQLVQGPSMIRDENGMITGYVYVDMAGRDVGGFVEEAKKIVAGRLLLPEGTTLRWSGQYENMLRVKERLKVVLPITLCLIFMLLYMNTKSVSKTALIMLAVPFSLIGAFWLLFLLHYNLSIAVWVGIIALMGLDAETGVFMLLFLDISYNDAVKSGRMNSKADLTEAIIHGAVKRIRPKLMTVAAAFIGLLPIMWSMETGSDVMKRIAAPMIGGLITSFLLELLIYPVIYATMKERKWAPQPK